MKAAATTLVDPGGHPPLRYDPYDYAIHEDPYPTYARLRDEAPVYRNDALDFWAYSRHADVLAAFRDVDAYSSAMGVSLDPAAFGPEAHRAMSFLAMDPPRHTRLRSLVGKSFTPSRVAQLEPRVAAMASAMVSEVVERGRFDFVADLAGRLPMDVISEMVGVPPADRAELRRLADLVVHRDEEVRDVPAAGVEAALTLAGYYADLVRQRRRRPADDLTSGLVQAELDGDRLSDDEIISVLFLMVVAGNETTTKLLANAWYWSWRHPDQGAAVLADPSLVPRWIEETLRYDTSSQMVLRVTRHPVEVAGTAIPEGSRVLLLIGSANRDASVFPDPDRYDLGRDTQKSLSFGGGRHYCMGAALARLESRLVLSELVRRVRRYEVDVECVERVHSVNVRGFSCLATVVALR